MQQAAVRWPAFEARLSSGAHFLLH